MYRCKSLAKLLTWHKVGASINGLTRNVVDSITWKHINEKWPMMFFCCSVNFNG